MRITFAVALACLTLSALAAAGDATAAIRKSTDIPAQGLGPALAKLAKEFDFQVLYRTEVIGKVRTDGASGEMTAEEALKHVLTGTGLTYKYLDDKTVTIVPLSMSTSGQSASPSAAFLSDDVSTEKENGKKSSPDFRMAQVDQRKGPRSPPVIATAQNPTPNPQRGTELNEIVVTATKRESTVQNTPISITAVSGVEIQERGIADLTSLLQSVPGVSMHTSGPGQTEFEMRGMASTGGNSPTVGFYLDDVPLTAPSTSSNGKVVIDPNLYDLNRVEVLRGPQGTLYGSGSMGGTIKVVTNAPNPAAFDTSGEVILSGTDGGGFNHGENAMLNVPFAGGTAALRIVVSDSSTSGWVDRIVIANGAFSLETNTNGVVSPTGTMRGNVLAAPVAADYRDVNNEDLTAARASLIWRPTDRLTMTGSYFYQQIYQEGGYADSNPGTNAHYQPFDAPEPFSDYFNLGNFTFKYRFDALDVTSTTSHYTRSVSYHQDGAEEWQWVLGLPSYYASEGGIGPFTPTPVEIDKSAQTTEELRVTSSGGSPFQWLFGYFYGDLTSSLNADFSTQGAVPLFGLANLFAVTLPTTIIQNSFFSELSYQLTPQIKATVGARRYSYDVSVNQSQSGVLATGSNSVEYTSSAEHDQGVDPKFVLSYETSDKLLLYSTIAKGFRPGGGTTPVPTSGTAGATCEADLQAVYGTSAFVPAPNTFAPDGVWNYEIGEKLVAFENRLTVNSALYFENWSGIQQNIVLPCGFGYVGNAGDAHVYGSEVEIQAALTQGLVLSANVGYTHATVVSSVLGANVKPGSRVQDVPDWTSSFALAYRHGISGELAFTARIENDYVGPRTDATFAVNQLPSYDLTSVRTGIEDSQWSAVFFVSNVFNKKLPVNDIGQVSANLPTYNRVVTLQPLTVGVDVNYRFGR